MSWRLLALSFTLVPALFTWWSGRRIVHLVGDPALAERLLVRQNRQQLVLFGCTAALVLTPYAWVATPCAFVGAWIGDLPSRRVLFEERWSLATYLSWQGRFAVAWLGFWVLLFASPLLISETVGTLRWPVAFILAAGLIAWNHRYSGVFLWLVRATAIPAPASWESVMRHSTVSRPRLLRLPVPGGRFVNAFAFPSRPVSAVLFSESLLESFDEDEQAAVLGHEMAHLESFDGARLRHLGLAVDAIALGSTVGIALVLHWLAHVSVLLVAFLWTGGLLGALVWWFAAQKAHETASDERAVRLCGNPEAVVRALVKLTVLNRLPRRWGLDFDRACSHPSLARRIQLVRLAAGVVAPPLEIPVEIAVAVPGSFVVFEADRVVWLDGVPGDCPRTPAAMRERARQGRTVAYSDLVDLRIVAGLFGHAKLVAADRAGESWAVPLEAAAIPALQAVLDRTDGLLAHGTVEGAPPTAVGRIVSLVLIGVAALGQAIGVAVLAGVIGFVRPSRAALAGVAAVGASCVLLYFEALGRAPTADLQLISLAGAGLVTAAAVWLAARGQLGPERRIDLILPIGAYAAATLLAWTPLAWEVAREAGALPLGVAIHRTPVTWITALALAAALVTVPRRSMRLVAGALTAAVVIIIIALSLADRASVVAARETNPAVAPEAAAVVSRIELPVGSARLRLSPSGRRFAVALPGRSPAQRFLTGTLGGEPIEFPAVDLQFIDDDHALVVAPAGDAHVLRHVDVRAPGTILWQVAVTNPPDPYIEYLDGARWALGASNASEGFVGVFGRLGQSTVEHRRWRPDLTAEDQYFRVEALSPEHALEVVTFPTAMARVPWGPLLYWRSGQSTESRVWLLRDATARHLATWPGAVRCVGRTHAAPTAVCVGWRSWEGGTVVWRLDPASSQVGPPIAVPGDVWRWGVSHDAWLLALHAQDTVTLVDLGQRSLVRRRVERESGFTMQVLPRPRRLAMLWAIGNKRVLTVYDTR